MHICHQQHNINTDYQGKCNTSHCNSIYYSTIITMYAMFRELCL